MDSRKYSRTQQSFADGDARLEAIVEAAVDDLAAGVDVDVETLAAAHPEYADRLRELLPMVLTMADLGGAMQVSDSLAGPLDGHGGERKLGDFRVIRELGRGGMGTVFEAEQLSMGRRVALKVLPFAALADENALKRFRNEVRAAAALDHPHIVSVYSVGEERGVHYYAMQLIRGQTLADWIRDQVEERTIGVTVSEGAVASAATLPTTGVHSGTTPGKHRDWGRFRMVARLGVQAAEALQHAHDQGVLHRDIKPSNLLLDAHGDLFIADFGLARIEADAGLTTTGDLIGTLRYMAPEQAAGNRVVIDHRADVYALGATLYELLALRPAFDEAARAELLKKIAFEEPPALQKLDRRIPTELETIVAKAMTKEPEERYQSAQLLADDLRAFLDHRPIKARPATTVDRVRKWSRRHQSLAFVLAGALTVLSTVLVVSMLVVNRARSTAVEALAQSAESAKQLADQLYEADITLAYHYWEKGWSQEIPALLERHRPAPGAVDRRGYEWHLLHGIVRPPKSMVLAGHKGSVNEIAVFPDGRRIASVGDDGCLRIWDAVKGSLLTTVAVSPQPLQSVAISPNGQHVATANEGVYLCELDQGAVFREIYRSTSNAESLAFSLNGERLAAGFRYHEVCTFALDGNLVYRRPCHSRVESLEYIPTTGQLLVPERIPVSDDPTDFDAIIQLWKADAAQDADVPALSSNNRGTFARPSPSGRHVAVGSRYLSEVEFFDAQNGKLVATTASYRDQANDLGYAPDGSAIGLAHLDGVIQRIDLAVNDEEQLTVDDRPTRWEAHRGSVNCVRFLSPGRLASCGLDGLVKVWDLNYGETLRSFAEPASALSACLSPDGQRILVVLPQEVLILDANSMRVSFRREQAGIRSAQSTWSPDSRYVATWDDQPGLVTVRTFDGQFHRKIAADFEVMGVDFAPDAATVAAIGEQTLKIFDVESGALMAQRSLPNQGRAVRFAHRRDLLAYAGRCGEIILADAELKRMVRAILWPIDVETFAFSSDDSLLASGHRDGVIRIWRVDSGQLVGEIPGQDGSILSLAFTKDDRAILSSAADGMLRVASVPGLRSYGVVFRRPGLVGIGTPYCRLSASADCERIAAFVDRAFPINRDVLVWDVDISSGD